MAMFAFQNLDVYQCATEFLALSLSLSTQVPRGHRDVSDQLRRAALSIPLNIAEGSGKFGRDGGRYYGIARGSALECAAIFDALELIGIEEHVREEMKRGRELLVRGVSRLTKMAGR